MAIEQFRKFLENNTNQYWWIGIPTKDWKYKSPVQQMSRVNPETNHQPALF